MNADELCQFLTDKNIEYERLDHEAVFTCEEARRVLPDIKACELKNLFLRDGKGKRHMLLATLPDKKVSLKNLGAQLNINGVGMASPERLKKYLNLEAGAVTLLGVINDKEKAVEILIDRDIWSSAVFQCHPLVNTSTLLLKKESLLRFFEICEHDYSVIDVPSAE